MTADDFAWLDYVEREAWSLRDKSTARLHVLDALWTFATLALIAATVADAVLLAAILNGAASPWALPFAVSSALWVAMAGPRAARRWLVYGWALSDRREVSR